MNIIQLFGLLDLKRDQILEFDSEDYIRIEKKINFEKKINTEIDSKAGENLILALKEHKEAFLFLMSNRILFNFFTHNNLSKNHFSNAISDVSEDNVKRFIADFLADDLISFFSLKLAKNTYDSFEELNFLLDLKEYFPEEVCYKMTSQIFSKLDFAVHQLAVSELNDFSNINYIQYRSFYDLLSHFTTFESDIKICDLLDLVIRFYEMKTNDAFFNTVFQSMAYYIAFDENINETLAKNSDAVSVFKGAATGRKRYPTASILIGLISAIIPFLVSKCS